MRNVLLAILPVYWPKMPPLGLGYLQSYLAENGIDADILDLNNTFYNLSDDEIKKQWLVSCNCALEKNILSLIKRDHFKKYDAAIENMTCYKTIGFSCFKSNFITTLEIIKTVKSRKKDIKIILGGPEITRQFFKTGGKFESEVRERADFLVVGEGEKPLCDYLKGRKKITGVAKFDELENLSALSFPRYRGVDFGDYIRKDAVALQFSRGCIKKCGFCSERLLYKGFRRRDPDSVIDEIAYHKARNAVNYFVFFDSLINGDLKALEDLCDKIIDNFGSVRWEAQIAVRKDMKEETFEKMKRSGCYNLFVGLESGADRTLEYMHKGFRSKDAVVFFKALKSSGFFFGVSIIVGYPHETEADFKESLEFIIRNKDIIPKIEQVNPFTYYEGTSADKNADYKRNARALEKMDILVREIRKNNFKYTNAFLGNLIEKNGGVS